MKFNAQRPALNRLLAQSNRTSPKRAKRVATVEASTEASFVTVQLPYCPVDGAYKTADAFDPYLQLIYPSANITLAAVLRDPTATANINDRTQCVPRIFTTQVPSDPIVIEAPHILGAAGIVQPDDVLNNELMSQFGLTTQLVNFVHTATKSPQVSMSYGASPFSLYRNLVDAKGESIDFYPAATQTAALVDVQSLIDHIGASQATQSADAMQKRTLPKASLRLHSGAPTTSPTYHTYTATLLENVYFSGGTSLNFNTFSAATATPVVPSTVTAQPTQILQSQATNSARSVIPTTTAALVFAPVATSYVQANVIFKYQGQNPNVALSFANYGAVVTLAVVGAVAMAGFTYMRNRRTPAASIVPAAVPATSAPSADGDDIV